MASREEGAVLEVLIMEDGRKDTPDVHDTDQPEPAADVDAALSGTPGSVSFVRQLVAEFVATFFLTIVWCGMVTVHQRSGMAAFPGVVVAWGMVVMALVYAVGHVSGAHTNPVITIGFAVSGRFPRRKVPAYMVVQTVSATLASLTLRLMFGAGGSQDPLPATPPAGSNIQSLVLKFISTFCVMFVADAVATDDRADAAPQIGRTTAFALGGIGILDLLAWLLSDASMDTALWVHFVGPIAGAVAGTWVYFLVHPTKKFKFFVKVTETESAGPTNKSAVLSTGVR